MTLLGRRAAATAFDAGLAYALTSAVLVGLSAVGETPLPLNAIWLPTAFTLVLLGSFATEGSGRASPGKKVLGLVLIGSGCALCREVRKIGPFLPWAAAEFVTSLAELPLAGWISATLFLAGLLWHAHPVLLARDDFPYNFATGFRVALRPL